MRRPRKRPILDDLSNVSIPQLKEFELLKMGSNGRYEQGDGVIISTRLAGKKKFCRVQYKKGWIDIKLVSRPLGTGLVWYFRDEVCGALCTKFYFAGTGFGCRK